jgi:hypothetical protein
MADNNHISSNTHSSHTFQALESKAIKTLAGVVIRDMEVAKTMVANNHMARVIKVMVNLKNLIFLVEDKINILATNSNSNNLHTVSNNNK